ncbi:MAG: peptidoglycan bridge formation protein FemAB [Deltaproteobacteria bacterium]|nr:MAG: peptidoglycan bridge formation protein FemAB [Deltaproteobacteria bacterium]
MPLNVRFAEKEDYADWDEYVYNHLEGTLFHMISWKNVAEKTFGHQSFYLIAEKNKKICGICPVFQIKSFLFGNFFISVPFAEIGGILADDEITKRLLLKHAGKIAKAKNADYIELRNRIPQKGLETKSLYYTFKKEISQDNEENLKAIPRKSRAMVRKAIKMNLESETGHHLIDLFYEILATNYHRLGTPVFPKKFFKNFLGEFKEKADILIVRTEQNQIAAGVLFFIYKDQMIPYYAGSDFTYRNLGPNDFMYWELMKLAVEKGCKIFDYGRSKIGTGSFSFKKHWGFKPEPLAYQYELLNIDSMPNLSPSNPAYQKKIKIWRNLPYEITKLAGPFISRNLG